MKKIVPLAISMLLLTSILIPIASSSIFSPENSSSTMLISTDNPKDAISIEMTIKDGENWVKTYSALTGEIIRFRINVTYHDWDGEPEEIGEIDGHMLTNIILIDRLPSELIYLDNSNHEEKNISADEKTIMWEFNDITLYDNQSIIVEFDAVGNTIGTFVNNADTTGLEYDYEEYRCNTTHATVTISNNNSNDHLTKYRDVDNDTIDEIAIDYDYNESNGYEIFEDPNNSSHSKKSIDGDDDNKIDHFIDINNDEIPDRYWDPDDDILTNIDPIDVDYDGTIEWVYDSDNDGLPDRYYDPNNEQIHEYIVYKLIIIQEGDGIVQKNPDGILFLEGFNVQLTAIPDQGWRFDSWAGDISDDINPINIKMDSDIEIIALFINDITLNIAKPENNHLYFFNIGIPSNEYYKPIIIGPIIVKATAESEAGISKVEFYINNESTPRRTDNSDPYSWIWLLKPMGDEENYTITVKAYDLQGNTNTESITVNRPGFVDWLRDHKKFAFGLIIAAVTTLILLRNQGAKTDGVIPDDDSYNINKAPVIDIGGPYTGKAGKPIYFDASGTYDPDGDLLTYSWIFGDGSIGSGEKPSHIYYRPGRYTIKLTVTDSEGNYDTKTIEITITDGSTPLEEDDLFWYIVSALAIILTIAVALLYVGGKYYE